MEGYDVITCNDDKVVGHVVGTVGDNLIVEHGTLFKSRHALPKTFVEVDDGERKVRTTLSKEIIEDSPKVSGDGSFDEQAVAAHYGLADAVEGAVAEGYGDVLPDEMHTGAEADRIRGDSASPEAERAAVRENIRAEEGIPEGSSPGLLGDRYG